MRCTRHLKRVDVVPETLALWVQGRVHAAHAFFQLGGIVHTLGPGDDLLAAHEGVVGVGEGRVCRIEVGVKGARGGRVVR